MLIYRRESLLKEKVLYNLSNLLFKRENKKMRGEKKILYFEIFLILLITFLSFSFVFSADPGHSAPAIGPGTFESGNFIFPQNLSVLGNVGIGTTSPSYKLDVNGTARITGATYLENSKCPAGQVLTTDSSTGLVSCTSISGVGGISGSGTSNYLAKFNGTNSITNSVIYESGGNVGIGTTSPSGKLNINIGDLIFTYGSNYGNWRYGAKISTLDRLKGRQINNNPDFLEGTSGYNIYDNAGSGSISFSLINDDTAPNSAGRVLQINHSNVGSPSPGWGGFYKGFARCSGTSVGQCYREGNRIVYRIWAKIPSGYTINFASNSYGSGGNYQWLSSQAGTGNWEEYIGVQTIGSGGTFSSTGFWYITGGTRPFTWYVASVDIIDIDQPADVDRASELNVGYKKDVSLGTGNLLTTQSTYLAVDGGNVGIGTASPSYKLDVNGTARITGATYLENSKCPAGQVLTADPSTGLVSCTSISGVGGISGGGTSNYLAKFNGTNSITNSVIYESGGNVGIGTTSPENAEGWYKVLDVYGSGHSKIIATTSSVQTGIWSHNSGFYGAPAGGISGTKTNHPFSLITNGSARLTISNNGNVGIGTTSPDSTLHVIGGVCIEASDSGCSQSAGNLKATTIYQGNNQVLDSATSFSGNVTGSYNSLNLAPNSVDSSKVVDNSLTANDIAPNAITSAGGELDSSVAGNGLSLSSGALSVNTLSGGGIEISSDSLSLIRSCSSNQVLKWDGSNWVCSNDLNSGGNITGSGLQNALAYWTSSSSIGSFSWGTSGQVLQSSGSGAQPTWVDKSSFANTHTHDAANITSGTLGLARGGTGADLSAASNLPIKKSGSSLTAAAIDLSGSEVTNTLPATRGGTGISGAGGTANRVLLTTDGNSWSAGQVNLGTSMITGTLGVSNGGTGLTTSPDDNIMIGSGSAWQLKALPSCTSGKLLYDTSTNSFSCGTDLTDDSVSGSELDGVFSSTGILARIGSASYTTRTINGTSGRIIVTNGDAISGNPTIDLATTGVSAGTYGSSTQIPQIQIDSYGRITSASNVALSFTETDPRWTSNWSGLTVDRLVVRSTTGLTSSISSANVANSVTDEVGSGALVFGTSPTFTTDIRINDANTKITEGSGNSIRIQTDSGYVDVGPQNTGWSHFSTDRNRFYFNKGITVDTGQIGSYNGDLQLQTSGVTRMTILNSTGYVGIGIGSPVGILDILPDYAVTLRSANANYYGGFRWDTYGGETLIMAVKNSSSKIMIATGHDIVANQGSNNRIPSNPELTIYNGKVGIGTTNPGAKLSVSGGVGIGSSYASTSVSDGNLIVSGNVGIGTSNPQNTLNVIGSFNVTGATYLGNSKCSAGQVLTADASTGLVSCTSVSTLSGSGTAGNITRWSGASSLTNSVVYESGGNVGIGTTSPSQKLSVAGNISVNNAIVKDSAASDLIINANGGSVIVLL
ncbi:MAG: hypothetical protein QW273_01370 [Candidatus Pacearchaeota archaeon]